MTQFFIGKPTDKEEIILTGPEQHHLHVQRVKMGDQIWLFDEVGTRYRAEILECGKKGSRIKILEKKILASVRPISIHLAQALLKRQACDFVLQKAMELGLDHLYPMLSQNVASGANTAGRKERWQKVLLSAAKQCGRTDFFSIAQTETFSQILEKTSSLPLRLIAHTAPHLPPLKTILDKSPLTRKEILVMIGPEGGFTDQEMEEAKSKGIQPFSLGSLTLRAETATVAILANLQFYFATEPL